MDAVILAGGKGTRLAPYNTVFPKPLVPLGDRPILDILIHQLDYYGFSRITLSVGYLAELIEAYYNDGSPNVAQARIEFVKESKPLGTVGSLKMVGHSDGPFLVMNGDVLTTLDFSRLMEYHRQQGGELTIAVHKKHVKLDLGVMELDQDNVLLGFAEKPEYDYHVSMGIYVYEPGVLEYIGHDEFLDFPDLVLRMLADGRKVVGYHSDDYWMDLGSQLDYGKAQEEFESMQDMLLKSH